MSGIEMLTADNHKLYLRVQKLLNLGWKHERICDEIGLVGPRRVMDLCEWFIEYREPKKLPTVNMAHLNDLPKRYSPVRRGTERFLAWRKQNEGARKALEAMNAQ